MTGRVSWPAAPFRETVTVVGRRGGKSQILALIATYLACFRGYDHLLAPGQRARIVVLAKDREQAGEIFNYVLGLIEAVPLLAPMIVRRDSETIELSNRVIIAVATASFRSVRGYTLIAALCDELAFWPSNEESANPDTEILRAIRPGLASIPGSVLLIASSPYAKKGELYNSYRKHYAKDDSKVLIWKAPTISMNSSLDTTIITDAYENDPEAARAEYGAEFRDDLADYITREAVDAVTCWGRSELPFEAGITYVAFVDPSGGMNDSMTLAIAHVDQHGVYVLDLLLEIRPPFNPEDAVEQCTVYLRKYQIGKVIGDKFAGLWPVASFARCGITFAQSARPKSDIYRDLLP